MHPADRMILDHVGPVTSEDIRAIYAVGEAYDRARKAEDQSPAGMMAAEYDPIDAMIAHCNGEGDEDFDFDHCMSQISGAYNPND